MKIRRKLVLDVTYENVEYGDVERLEENLNDVAQHALGERLLPGYLISGANHVKVSEHTMRIGVLNPKEGEVVAKSEQLELLKNGRVRGTVVVDLNQFHVDDEWFLDLISEGLTGSLLLRDIQWRVVDVEDSNECVLEVDGDPSDIKDGLVAQLRENAARATAVPQ